MKTPVFVCTGFLDSGKSTLIKETLMEQDWIEPGLTLLILCEEGETDFPREFLEEKEMALVKADKFEQLNAAFFKNLVHLKKKKDCGFILNKQVLKKMTQMFPTE